MQTEVTFLSQSAEYTTDLGRKLGSQLKPQAIICFEGDLAAGKTTFIKGLVAGFADYSEYDVNSPTFVYLNIYEGKQTVYHFDLYRLQDEDEFVSVGFDDFFQYDGICCIEWSERIKNILPSHAMVITMAHVSEQKRTITIRYDDENQKISF